MQRQDLLLKNCQIVKTLVKNQSSITSIEYDHLLVSETIIGTFNQNPLKTVGGVVETRLCVRMLGLTDGRTDGRTHYYSPLRLTSGVNNGRVEKVA